jgi:hypothetical protein
MNASRAGVLIAAILPGYPLVGTASLLEPYPFKAFIVVFESLVSSGPLCASIF